MARVVVGENYIRVYAWGDVMVLVPKYICRFLRRAISTYYWSDAKSFADAVRKLEEIIKSGEIPEELQNIIEETVPKRYRYKLTDWLTFVRLYVEEANQVIEW